MSAKVYVLLNLVHANTAQVVRILRGKPGVAEVDVLEGPPDIIMVIEAPERLKVAEYLVDILDSVDDMTENSCVLPVRKSAGKKSRRNSAAGQNVRGKLKDEMTSHV